MKSGTPIVRRSLVALPDVGDADRSRPDSLGRAAEPRLLATKLFVPVTRAACVPRPRLQAQLERGLSGPLTLLSAPAGSGKTTLVATWLRASKQSAAWLSLDDRDNDLGRFLRYFIAAIARQHAGFAADLLVDPKAFQLDDPFDLATDLVNEIAVLGEELVVVLDDVHVLDATAVHDVLTFVVEACPPNLHLVMTTRVDPALPLSRLRARGLLTEIRAPELRFTKDESAAFLSGVMGVQLTDAQVERLEFRTEGWAVGLQMAALSLQGREDAGAFIEGFAGSHRYVLDYLMDEVLQRLPEESRVFLMQTSILRQLTGPIVDVVTERSDGAVMLASLERSNVFTIPLDSSRTAYRYHHLFGTLLRHELEATASGETLRALHGRASRALEVEGYDEDAVHHALLAEDYERAERLLVPVVMGSTIRGEGQALARLVERFPAHYAESHPQVQLLAAWLDYYSFKFGDLCKSLEGLRPKLGGMTAAQEAEFDLLLGMAACEAGEQAEAFASLERLDALPQDRPYLQSFQSMHKACVAMMDDRLDEARVELEHTRAFARQTDDHYAVLWAQWQAAHVDLLLGQLDSSRRTHDVLLETAMRQYCGRPPTSALVGFATGIYLTLHQHDLVRARELASTASAMGRGLGRHHGYASCLLLPKALLEVQTGEGEDWSGIVDQAIRHLDAMDQASLVPRIEAQRVRLALHHRSGVDGRAHAERWLAIPGVRDGSHEVYKPNPLPGVQVDHPRFVLARSLAAVGETDEALEVVAECLARARAAGRVICQVEALLLEADIGANVAEALSAAVALAAPIGLLGPFLEFERSVLSAAVTEAQVQGHRGFAKQLLAARCERAPAPVGVSPVSSESIPAPSESLSDRELEVLGLVAEGLSNAEASRKLFIAPSTVKKHLEHIYGKLGVNRRTQAVARARTLGLLREEARP
ncbi:MAG: LuxR C-terminal-related transcriptional regulator [Myxococcota bacterium]